ncbi:hypothetical protein PtA15_7A389 [Puccinia triticina]|uniref:Uncharacterized protein n=1 Tax=Puccinia triticina TaxID=208348 RepID=A0ABY7CN55_9BASI|nr:uncharacterized protein PtA15_7A389 [Puccinia triticina]WAQ86661.1 hypothetical protein PtA15_7A389 [Puccinia triticina]
MGLRMESFHSPQLLDISPASTPFEAAMASNAQPGSLKTIPNELFHHPPDRNTAGQSLLDPPPLPPSVVPSGDSSQQVSLSSEAANKPAHPQPDHNTSDQNLPDQALNKPADHLPNCSMANWSLPDPPPLPPIAVGADVSHQVPPNSDGANKLADHRSECSAADQSLLDPLPLPPSVVPSVDASQQVSPSSEALNKPAHSQPDHNTSGQILADPPLNKPAYHQPDHSTADRSLPQLSFPVWMLVISSFQRAQRL